MCSWFHLDGFSNSFWKSNETLAAFLGLSDESVDAILVHLFVSFGQKKEEDRLLVDRCQRWRRLGTAASRGSLNRSGNQ